MPARATSGGIMMRVFQWRHHDESIRLHVNGMYSKPLSVLSGPRITDLLSSKSPKTSIDSPRVKKPSDPLKAAALGFSWVGAGELPVPAVTD